MEVKKDKNSRTAQMIKDIADLEKKIMQELKDFTEEYEVPLKVEVITNINKHTAPYYMVDVYAEVDN